MAGSARCYSLGKRLTTARVRPIEDVQRLLRILARDYDALHMSGLVFRTIAGLEQSRGGNGKQARRLSTGKRAYIEMKWLDRQGLFDGKFVRGILHHKVETLHDGDKCQLGFLPGEWTALNYDAFSTENSHLGELLTIQARIPKPKGCQAFG